MARQAFKTLDDGRAVVIESASVCAIVDAGNGRTVIYLPGGQIAVPEAFDVVKAKVWG
jgi:hypothetical protein